RIYNAAPPLRPLARAGKETRRARGDRSPVQKPAQVIGKIFRSGIPLVRELGQALQGDRLKITRNVPVPLSQWLRDMTLTIEIQLQIPRVIGRMMKRRQ